MFVCDIITDHRFVLLFRDSLFLTVFPLISISQLCNRYKILQKKKMFLRQSFLKSFYLCVFIVNFMPVISSVCFADPTNIHIKSFLRAVIFYCYFQQQFQNLQTCRCKRYICLEVSPLVCLCSLSVFTTVSSHTELCCLKNLVIRIKEKGCRLVRNIISLYYYQKSELM